MSHIIQRRPTAAFVPRQHVWRLGTGALGLLALATMVQAAGTPAPRRGATSVDATRLEPVVAGERIDLRTEGSTTVALPDGALRTTIGVAPVNRRDTDGRLVPIDTSVSRLDEVDAQGFAFAAGGGLVPMRFASDSPRVLTSSPMGDIVQAPLALRYTDGRQVDLVADVAQAEAQVSGDAVTYPKVFPGVDLVYTVRETGLAHELVLRERPRNPAPGLDPANTWLELGETLRIPAGSSLTMLDGSALKPGTVTTGSLAIHAPGARPMIIGTPTAYETAEMAWEEGRSGFPVSQAGFSAETAADGSVTLWTRVPWSWLGDSDRRFPVVIDPVLVLQPDEAASKDSLLWEAISPGGNFGTLPALVWGSQTLGPSHGIIEFDLSSIPAGSTIISATLDVGPWTGFPGSTGSYQILENTGAWAENTVTWLNRPPVNPTPVDVQTHAAGAHRTYNVTASVAAMVAGSLTNNGWRISPNPTGSNHTASVGSSSQGVADRPKLTVDYTIGGGGSGSCDLTPVLVNIARLEAKLDDGSRFTSDAELNAQTAALNAAITNAQNNMINNNNAQTTTIVNILNDGTRFTSDAERIALQNTLVTEINANETKIDRLEVKLDTETSFTDDSEFAVGLQALAALEAKADEEAANTDYARQVQIEHALGEDNNVNKPMILYMLPAAGGGHLEEVRDIVDLRITQAEANGCSTGGARGIWNNGNAEYGLSHWDDAYAAYAAAYKTASMGPCN